MAFLRCLFQPAFHSHFGLFSTFTALGRRDLDSVLAIGGKDAMKSREVDAGLGD